MRNGGLAAWMLFLLAVGARAVTADDVELARDVLPLFKARCVKCHGPAKQEGKLDLSTPAALARGGENGAAVTPGQSMASRLWQRIDADEMPPEDPLSAEEKATVHKWIAGGAMGLTSSGATIAAPADHWAFRPLANVQLPEGIDPTKLRTPVDSFLLADLRSKGLTPGGEADRPTLIRRVSFDLTGLPPTVAEIATFLNDPGADAYEKMVERYLASAYYGQRWGKYWLDAAGYADSNGYFNADSDRPLAYRYRDWVVRALNDDQPFDRFIVEQLAGDELAGFTPGQTATPEQIALLEASHFVRNGQDGSGESDGNPDEVRTDRYCALEGAMQIVSSSLLGLTMQCAKCHDHKFEPITQRDYYQLQAVFYPMFNVDSWVNPRDRFVYANLSGEAERWEAHSMRIDAEIATRKAEFATWAKTHRPPSEVLFHDEFADSSAPLAENWSHTAPGDDVPAGDPPAELEGVAAPAARRQRGALQIVESGGAGDRWLS
ncbi:MAG TPA: DUF1549 domain-containing protein, partial [Pirellulales bacterium]|nr:DUF1549 domain-containing protein [Pirellulales bacterium]